MKKALLVMLLIILAACGKDGEKVFDTNPDGYYPFSETELENTEELVKLINTDIQTAVLKLREESNINDDDITGKFNCRVLIDENGNLDKIFIFSKALDKIDNKIISMLENFDYKTGTVNDNNVKYKFDIDYTFTKYYKTFDVTPQPVGGMLELAKKIVYPQLAKRAGIEGRVYIKAMIDSTGKVDTTEVVRGLGVGLDEAAMKAVRETLFTPAQVDGRNVPAEVTIPIMFKIQ